MKDSFSEFHPLVNLIYFALVIGFSLSLNHPLAQGISLVCAFLYIVLAEGKKSIGLLLKFGLPLLFFTAIINCAFNHRGQTALFILKNGNPITLESIFYGFFTGVMLITLLLWFSSFNRVMTTDKFIFLFGKVIPALSLVLSMALRFVPKFKNQMDLVKEAQQAMGMDISKGKLFQRAKTAIRIFLIMVTWAFENAIETADSMKSRGYGLKKRTSFGIFAFCKRDLFALLWLVLCFGLIILGLTKKAFFFLFFPAISFSPLNLYYLVYFALLLTPVIINIKEEIKWKTTVWKT